MAAKFGSLWRVLKSGRDGMPGMEVGAPAIPEPLFKSVLEPMALDPAVSEPEPPALSAHATPSDPQREPEPKGEPEPQERSEADQGSRSVSHPEPGPEQKPEPASDVESMPLEPETPGPPLFVPATPNPLVPPEEAFDADLGTVAVDRIAFRADGIAVSGWAWFGSSAVAMRLVSTRLANSAGSGAPLRTGRLLHEFRNFKLPSLEFVHEHGDEASHVRFDEIVEPRMSVDAWDIAFAALVLELKDGRQLRVPFTGLERGLAVPPPPLVHPPRLGIGITTFNRSTRLEQVLDGVIAHTRTPYDLIVCDDGSTDDTIDVLRRRGIPHIAAPNRGIAWNKNRVFYYLAEVRRCDALIVIEDDTTPTEPEWEHAWMAASLAYGHVNYRAPWFNEWPVAGWGQWWDPAQSRPFTGQCIGLSRYALMTGGYMDTRFKSYGFEHIEHTIRLGRHGFGFGKPDPDKPEQRLVYLINSHLKGLAAETHGTGDDLFANAPIFHEAMADRSYREAWRTPEQREIMLAEMASVSAW